jgi:arsenate reductase
MKALNLDASIVQVDIKKEPLSATQIDELHSLTQSYEALFNKRAQLYKQRDLKNQTLEDADYRSLLIEHYTFLKRPVLLYDNTVFIGNSSPVVEAAKEFLNEQ